MRKLYFLLIVFVSGLSQAQIINFPDANFKAKLLSASPENDIAAIINDGSTFVAIDTNGNGEIEAAEAQAIIYLHLDAGEIVDLSGLENFTNLYSFGIWENPISTINLPSLSNLQWLSIGGNPNLISADLSLVPSITKLWMNNSVLPSIDVSMLPNLEYFECVGCQLQTIDFSNNTALRQVNSWSGYLTSLDLTQNIALESLNCSGNELTNLNISGLGNLENVNCAHNLLTALDLNGTNLISLDVSNNPITAIDLSYQSNLQGFDNYSTLLSTVDFSACPLVHRLMSNDCPNLTTVNIKNGYWFFDQFQIMNCPSLTYICANDYQAAGIQSQVNYFGYNCTVNSYCSFNPGGTFYSVQGAAEADADNNGCNSDDTFVPFFKVDITDGLTTGSSITGSDGNIDLRLQQGLYTITPVNPNPSYFNLSPSSIVIEFPAQSSPFTQNFCLTPVGNHSDLEVTLVPLDIARPGFDAHYKLICKNKGNQVQSGTLGLSYNDDAIDFVTSSPGILVGAPNLLTWDFDMLAPFESNAVYFMMNLNSPVETPPLNNGDVLQFTAVISTANSDETPENNSAVLNQTLVNSIDPNDKTCLEGTTISPEMAGGYVHYQIRFENTGTANAQNIVVKDMIDTNKFDVNSLVALDGSHDYYTRINGNKVEFIFENINLPFDDANNDGYVVFKIRTKPTLVLGDTFSNTASIYFDYNHPIVTNTATTTLSLLQTKDFEFPDYISIYPNPADDVLKIETKNDIEISSANIYSTSGQLILTIPNMRHIKSIDVSALTTGDYFLSVVTDKGKSNIIIVKK
jgi:hypothetical protein